MRNRLIPALFLGLFLISGQPAVAGESPAVLSVAGAGSVAVRPDQATLTMGVEIAAPSAEEALTANAARMAVVFAALQDAGVKPADMQTSQLSVHPQWDNQNKPYDQPLKITGFLATNMLQITVRDLGSLGVILDVLTKVGANRIEGVYFGVAEPGPHLDSAREAAVTEALRKGALFARAAGMTLGPILSIDEAGAEPRPMFRVEAMVADAVPIAEGEVSFSASVTVRFALIAP